MRRLAAVLALTTVVVALIVVLGRNGGHDRVTPLGDALGAFPRDAALVAAVDTDEHGKQAQAFEKLLGRLPVGGLILDRVAGGLRLPPLGDLRPLLGNPLVIGLEQPVALRRLPGDALVVAIRVPSATKAKQILLSHGLRPVAAAQGRRIFVDPSGRRLAVAVDGSVLVASRMQAAVAQALANRHSDAGMREQDFERDLAGLPADAGVRVSADPRLLLAADPKLRPVLGQRWVAALRRAGATLRAEPDGLGLRFRLRTDPKLVSGADLPLEPGRARAPIPLIGRAGEVAVGIREPARVARFGASLLRALEPSRVARAAGVARSRRIDFGRDFAGHLGETGTLAFDPATRQWAARVAVRDPATVMASLAKLADSLPDVAAALGMPGMGVATPEPGESFYALARPRGTSVVFGVIGAALVAASRPQRAAGLASEGTHTAPGANGSLVVTVDARKLALGLLRPQLHGIAALGAPFVLGALGNLTASASADRNGLYGSARLTLK